MCKSWTSMDLDCKNCGKLLNDNEIEYCKECLLDFCISNNYTFRGFTPIEIYSILKSLKYLD